MGNGKERWRVYLARRKRWGVKRLKRAGEARRRVGRGEGGRAATVATDSGGVGTAERRQRGVRSSGFVWVFGIDVNGLPSSILREGVISI
jgi:L-aminopeptidase/D-esterase-like protein